MSSTMIVWLWSDRIGSCKQGKLASYSLMQSYAMQSYEVPCSPMQSHAVSCSQRRRHPHGRHRSGLSLLRHDRDLAVVLAGLCRPVPYYIPFQGQEGTAYQHFRRRWTTRSCDIGSKWGAVRRVVQVVHL